MACIVSCIAPIVSILFGYSKEDDTQKEEFMKMVQAVHNRLFQLCEERHPTINTSEFDALELEIK